MFQIPFPSARVLYYQIHTVVIIGSLLPRDHDGSDKLFHSITSFFTDKVRSWVELLASQGSSSKEYAMH